MPPGIIEIKINEKLKKQNILNKKEKLLSITKSQINRILKKNMENLLKLEKFFT